MIIRVGRSKLHVPSEREAAVRGADREAVDAALGGDPSLPLPLRLQQLHESVLAGSEDVSAELSLASDAALPPSDLTLREARALLEAVAPARSFLIPIGDGTRALNALISDRPTNDLPGHLVELTRPELPAMSEDELLQMLSDTFDPPEEGAR